MNWRKSNESDFRAADAPYAVSRATLMDHTTGELAWRYTAWRLLEPPFHRHIGTYATSEEAKAACEIHLQEAA